jgi:hypothetical protein
MINNPKSTKDVPADSPARDIPPASATAPFVAFATLFHKGVERFAEMQKNTLDIVANQTTDAIGAWKQAFAVPPSAPGAFLFDLFDQGMEKLAQTQKGMIDLAVQQSAHAIEATKERRDSASKWTTGMADIVSEATERTVAAHKIMLDFAAEQNKVVAAAVKRQAGLAGAPPVAAAVDTLQRNLDMAIQTQKELVEAAAKPLKAAAAHAA